MSDLPYEAEKYHVFWACECARTFETHTWVHTHAVGPRWSDVWDKSFHGPGTSSRGDEALNFARLRPAALQFGTRTSRTVI